MEVLQKQKLTDDIFSMKIKCPDFAEYAKPGHYIIVKAEEKSKRTPLFISGNDKRSVSVVVSGATTEGKKLTKLRKGSSLALVAGLYGHAFPVKEYGNVAWVAENEHIGMMCYLAEELKKHNNKLFMIAGYKNKKKPFLDKKIKKTAHKFAIVSDKKEVRHPVLSELHNLFRKRYIHLFTMKANPPLMQQMANISHLRAKTYSCMSPAIGDDGIGCSGKSRILVNNEMRLVSVEGPFFDAHMINWNQLQ